MRTYIFRERNKINLMDYGDGSDIIMLSIFRSHEEVVEKWWCLKVIYIILDSEVVYIIYKIKVVSE